LPVEVTQKAPAKPDTFLRRGEACLARKTQTPVRLRLPPPFIKGACLKRGVSNLATISHLVIAGSDPQSGFIAFPTKKDQALPVLFWKIQTGKK
jgi:hypothetical protein